MSTIKCRQKECKFFVADLAEVGFIVDVFASLNKFSSYLRPQRGRLQQTQLIVHSNISLLRHCKVDMTLFRLPERQVQRSLRQRRGIKKSRKCIL